jgi:hypothetical protein
MTLERLASRLRTLEQQVALLRAEVQRELERSNGSRPIKTFGDLYGIWAEHGDFSEEEIDACLFRFDWEDAQLESAP